jgi:hypothetical protein
MKILILLLMMVIPQLETDTKNAERVELNHVYNNDGNHRLSQILIRKWMVLPDSVGYRIIKYHVVKQDGVLVFPHKNSKIISFYDRNGESHRYLTNSYSEYDSNYDVEVKDRDFLPEDDRRQ